MRKLAATLFPEPRVQDEFLDALLEGTSKETALIVREDRPEIRTFPRLARLPWMPEWTVRLRPDFRPGQHPLHDKGAYYVMDLSSIFAASAMQAIADPVESIFDLCASPGGKGIFAAQHFRPRELVANEVMRNRTAALISNLDRVRVEGSSVASADPNVWARVARQRFDLTLVDAPCSGQSLLAKGTAVPGAFSPQMVDMNHSRQRRILGTAIHTVKPGGHLLYMTCTYSLKENERIIAWLQKEYPGVETVRVPHLFEYQSTYTTEHCYRLFPQYGHGAGAFTCLLRIAPDTPLERAPEEEWSTIWRYGEPVPAWAVRQRESKPASTMPASKKRRD